MLEASSGEHIGPNVRAGFIDAPVKGPNIKASKATTKTDK